MTNALAIAFAGCLLMGCSYDDAAWEAYADKYCRHDVVTFEKYEPDSPGYKLCRDLIESGLYDFDYNLYGEDSFSQFSR